MPSDGVHRLYYGDYVAPFAIDGYFPLYRATLDAEKASTNGLAQSHGPGSSTGHPLSWSSGVIRLYFMPAAGPQRYYGNYYEEGRCRDGRCNDGRSPGRIADGHVPHIQYSLADAPLYSHAAALRATSPVGEDAGSLSAAQVVAAEATPTNTAAAAATLAAAPAWAR